MTYILIGAAILALAFWGGRRSPKRREWRFLAAAAALAAFAAAAYAAVRGAWGVAVVLLLTGLWLSVTTRVANPRATPMSPGRDRMSVLEARALLGVDEGASAEEVRAAYTRLMRLAHPDKGGTAGLAAQLNAARERLLSK